MTLAEKHRPQSLDQVIGQDKAVKVLQRFNSEATIGGRAFWIAGPSGTGKTTIAKILAQSIVSNGFDCREITGRELTPNKLKEISYSWMFAGGHALIVNESHGLTKPTIEIMLDTLENLPGNVVVIFTTTREGNDLFEEQLDAGPFGSRCISINLTNQGLAPKFATRAKEIAEREGLDGKPIESYKKLVQNCRNNMRQVLMEIESGAMLEN